MESFGPWIDQAIRNIYADYGARVSPAFKCKDLLKFGRNQDVETAIATLQIQPDGIDNETFVSSNLINTVVSSSGSDTEEVKIEGHTVDGNGDFTFVVQTATLTGQTPVTLSTALARVTRLYTNGSNDLVGSIQVTQTDTFTAGVADTDTKVHLMTRTGQNQSEKCSTTVSAVDYWIITGVYGDVLSKASGAFAEVDLEVRLKGKVFRQVVDFAVSDTHRGIVLFEPHLVVPSNSDVRLRAVSDSGTGRDVSGGIKGFLMKELEA